MPLVATDIAAVERAWWREHPDPQSTVTSDRLTLWNYPVSDVKLGDYHAGVLKAFVTRFAVSLDPEGTSGTNQSYVAVAGHASSTGEVRTNETIAEDRAAAVAAYLRGLGFAGIEVTAAGASQPADPSGTGQAFARNRRVEVTVVAPTFDPTPKRVELDPLPTGESAATPESPGLPGRVLELSGEWPGPQLDNGTITAQFFLVYTGQLKVIDAGTHPTAAVGIVVKDGRLSVKSETELVENLKLKVGFDPGSASAGKPPSLKVGLAGDLFDFPLNVGFQPKQNFVYASVGLPLQIIPKTTIGGVACALKLELTLRVELGLSPTLIAKYAAEAGATAGAATVATAAAVGGAVAIIIVINGGIIYAAEDAKEKFAALVDDTAQRDGAAARVTFEVLGADERARNALLARRNDVGRVGQTRSLEAFDRGRQVVEDLLKSLDDTAKEAQVQSWRDKYGKNSNSEDFTRIANQILAELGAATSDPLPVAIAVTSL